MYIFLVRDKERRWWKKEDEREVTQDILVPKRWEYLVVLYCKTEEQPLTSKGPYALFWGQPEFPHASFSNPGASLQNPYYGLECRCRAAPQLWLGFSTHKKVSFLRLHCEKPPWTHSCTINAHDLPCEWNCRTAGMGGTSHAACPTHHFSYSS